MLLYQWPGPWTSKSRRPFIRSNIVRPCHTVHVDKTNVFLDFEHLVHIYFIPTIKPPRNMLILLPVCRPIGRGMDHPVRTKHQVARSSPREKGNALRVPESSGRSWV